MIFEIFIAKYCFENGIDHYSIVDQLENVEYVSNDQKTYIEMDIKDFDFEVYTTLMEIFIAYSIQEMNRKEVTIKITN